MNNTKNTRKSKKEDKSAARIQEVKSLFLTLIVVIFIQSFLIQGYSTPTGSMENTILVGDKMFFNQFIYGPSTPRTIPFTEIQLPYIHFPGVREPKRGDIINFEFPGDRDEVKHAEYMQYLKRIIGEPGDKIEVINKVLYVNGNIFPNPSDALFDSKIVKPRTAVEPRIFPKGSPWNEDNYGPLTVPKKGDVVSLNKESYQKWDTFIKREGHNINMDASGKIFVDGKETSQYTVERNFYFMMGDHRDNSLDSRFWGFVPRENIVGKALITYWSWDSNISFSDFPKLVGSIRWDRIGKLLK
jgi:signal peptidase I